MSDIEPPKFPGVTQSNTVREKLRHLHDTDGKSFRDIGRMEEFLGIPTRTLHAIYSGHRDIPKKFRARFNLPDLVEVDVCPECGLVHTHKHGEEVFNPATQKVVFIPKPRKPRTPRNYPGKQFVF